MIYIKKDGVDFKKIDKQFKFKSEKLKKILDLS